MHKAGEFEIYVSEPYPCWCNLSYKGKEIRFSHKELTDLEYVIKKAIQSATSKLKQLNKDDEV